MGNSAAARPQPIGRVPARRLHDQEAQAHL